MIRHISDHKVNVVFILWGKFAQKKQVLIDETKHHVLKVAHPSPFSADKVSLAAAIFQKQISYWYDGLDPTTDIVRIMKKLHRYFSSDITPCGDWISFVATFLLIFIPSMILLSFPPNLPAMVFPCFVSRIWMNIIDPQ